MTKNNKVKLLTTEQFSKLDKARKTDYINSLFNLKENYLIGKASSQYAGQHFLIIKELINPYTGKRLPIQPFSDLNKWKLTAISYNIRLKDYDLTPGTYILFRFNVTEKLENLQQGELLVAQRESIMPINTAEDLLRELEIAEADILKIKENAPFDKVGYVSDFYRNIVHEFIEDKKQALDKTSKHLAEREKKLAESLTALENKKQDIAAYKEHTYGKIEMMTQSAEKKIEKEKNKLIEEKWQLEDQLKSIKEEVESLGFSLHHDYFFKKHQDIEQNQDTVEPPKQEEKFIRSIQKQIANRGLYYNLDTIRKFYTTLKTNQFTILSGPSGTGKTSLISAFAEVTSSKAKIIPVQPSWTDKQDLLGFYNPLDKQYIPTSFLDALIEAKQHEDRLYLICLDELNLAQVEYYFADLLSLREQKNVPLELYSQYEYDQNLDEIKWFVQRNLTLKEKIEDTSLEQLIEENMGVSRLDQFRYTQRYKNIQRYRWNIDIPKNVRFIGTMNIDGTVRPLSPKVVDRSFIIPLEKQTEDVPITDKKETYVLSFKTFNQQVSIENQETKEKLINELSSFLHIFHAGFNHRVENHIDSYIAHSKKLQVNHEQIIDEIILMKILPRINQMIDSPLNHLDEFHEQVKKLTGNYRESAAKIERMIEHAKQTKIFSYWG